MVAMVLAWAAGVVGLAGVAMGSAAFIEKGMAAMVLGLLLGFIFFATR